MQSSRRGSSRRRKVKYGRLVFIFVLIVGLVGGAGYVLTRPGTYAQYKDVNEDNKQVGSLESLNEEISDTMVKFLHYPEFDNESIDAQIKEVYNNIPDSEGISFLDYESKEVDGRYISVAFQFKKLSIDEKLESETHTYLNFDKTTGKKLALDDVFRRDYEKVIKEQAQKKLQLSVDTLDNVNFQVQDKGVRLLFDKDKEMTLAYSDYTSLIRLEGEQIPSIADQRLERKRTLKIDPNKPMVAFSFDDGPSPLTEEVMKIFEDNNANATFFMLGQNVIQYPDVVKKMYEQGFEIANHSWDHTDLGLSDVNTIHDQIYDTQDSIFKICGDEPSLLRPPYGSIGDNLINTSSLYLTLWNIDTEDWKSRDTATILERSRPEFYDGSVILFHDLYPTSVEAVRILVPELIAQGYQLVTTSELLEYRKEASYL